MTSISSSDIEAVLDADGSPTCLGRGGFGAVFLARLKHHDEAIVAVKSVTDLANPAAAEQFRREYALHLKLSQRMDGVCRIFGMCEGHPLFHTCFVMRRYAMSLLDKIKQTPGGLALPRVLSIAARVARTMAVLHTTHKLVVADLKPSNILLDERGDAVISDFGVSRIVSSTMGSFGLSASKVGGTFNFQSPEQLGAEDEDGQELRVTIQSDVWNFACTLVHTLTGIAPWWDDAKDAPRSQTFVFKRVVIQHCPPPELARINGSQCFDLLTECFEFCAAERPIFDGDGGIAAVLDEIIADVGVGEYQAMLDTLRFPLEVRFPKVMLSYATATDGGQGELWMWRVACALREVGIATYNGKQNVTAGDWYQSFFGKLPEAMVFVAFLSPEYFESWACRREIYMAASHDKAIIPLIIATPPAGLRQGNPERYFGKTEAEKSEPDNIEKGNVVSMHTNNILPPPDRGFFQDDFDGNCAILVDLIQRKLGIM